MKNLFLEIKKLIINFIKPYGIKDPILEVPKEVKKMGIKVGSINFVMTFISLAFAFLLKISNMMIEYRLILLGIILFMLYRGKQVITNAFRIYEDSENQKFQLIYEDEIVYRGSGLIGKTSGKILKYDKSCNLYKIMSNEAVLNSIKNYLDNYWKQKVQHVFDIYEILSVFVMLFIAILTNNTIPQAIFIPLILFFSVISFLSSAYISINRRSFFTNHRKYNNEQSIILNDLLRVPTIVRKDLNMRIEKYQKSKNSSNKNIHSFFKKTNKSRFIITVIEVLSHYAIIVLYLMGVEWNSISLATIAEVAATLLIVETALDYIGRIARILDYNNDRLVVLDKESEDINLILDVYHKEEKRMSTSKVVNEINLKPFEIKYFEESENDKPFTLVSNNDINLSKGDVAILYGSSGSGKSTFMKLITERIKIEKNTDIPSTNRYLYYDEKLKFGSLSIYEELFCDSKNPDLDKMKYILENLHLWQEIDLICFDVWKWMQEKRFQDSLSNGQKQRLILAKILYFLDDEVDVVVFDEATSGLDDEKKADGIYADKVLEFLVKYSNSDKKRIVIISTHQNIDEFKNNIKKQHHVKDFYLRRLDKSNVIEEK